MIQELQNYVQSRRESLEQIGIEIGIKNSEIRPNIFKLSITLKGKENVADFTMWDKGPTLPIETDIIILNVPSGRTTTSKSLQPKQIGEVVQAFDELANLLK